MYRIIFLSLMISLSVSAKEQCFSYKDKFYKVFKKSKSHVVLESVVDSEIGNIFFCVKKGAALHCQGDDDAGSFILEKEKINFNSNVSLGISDGPSLLIKFREAKSLELKACTKSK